MTEGYEEDLDMYEERANEQSRQLDNEVLMRPIRELEYPRNPITLSSGDTVSAAVKTMSDKKFGAVPVVEGGRVVGIFTERDLLRKGLYEGKKLTAPLKEFMTKDPSCLSPQDPIAFALNRMVVGGYRHIPLVDTAGAIVGLVAMRDVMTYVMAFFPEEVLNVPPHSAHNPPDRNVDGG